MDMNMDEISRNVQNNKQSICARVCTMRKRILFQKQTNKQQQQQQQNKTRKKKTNKQTRRWCTCRGSRRCRGHYIEKFKAGGQNVIAFQ